MTTPLEQRSLSELRDLEAGIFDQLTRHGSAETVEPDERGRLMALRATIVGQMSKLNDALYNPAADNNQRLRSNDYQIPEPPVAVDQRRATPETIAELQQMANALPDDSTTKPAILKRIELDQALVDQETQNATG